MKVSNSDIQAFDYGIYLIGHNTTSYEAEILNNKIHTYFGDGIYLYNSGGKIRNNEIYSGTKGIYCNYHSSPKLGEAGYFGYNNIHNTSYGVYCYNYSNPFLGRYNCTDQGGLNTIENCSIKLIYADNKCHIDAENNWWGSDWPNSSKFYASNNSSIDYDPWHHSPPNQSSSNNSNSPEEVLFNTAFASTSASPGAVNESSKKYDYNPKWPIRWKLLYARNLIFVKDYKFAVDICKSIIDENPDSSLSSYALDLLWQGSRNYDVDGFKSYLKEKTSSKVKKELYGDMELILSSYETGKSSKVQSIESTAQKYAGTSIEEAALFQKFMHYFNDEENTDMAKETSGELDKKFPKSESAFEAHRILEGSAGEPKGNSNSSIKKETVNSKSSDVPKEYSLLGNYPNPFNPSTTISYTLPYNSEVSITVYNIAGQLVKVFTYNSQAPGYHKVNWDGRNTEGEKAASGIYIYRFKAVSLENNGKVFEKSAKLMLLK